MLTAEVGSDWTAHYDPACIWRDAKNLRAIAKKKKALLDYNGMSYVQAYSDDWFKLITDSNDARFGQVADEIANERALRIVAEDKVNMCMTYIAELQEQVALLTEAVTGEGPLAQ